MPVCARRLINVEEILTFRSRLLEKILHLSILHLSYLDLYQCSSVLCKQNNKGSDSSSRSFEISFHCAYICICVLSTAEIFTAM